MSATPSFRRGAEAAEEATKSSSFARTHYFSLDDKESTILRFLTDAHEDPDHPHVEAYITVLQHNMVPTKPKPADYPSDWNWPSRMGAVCRKDPAFEGIYEDCYICDVIIPNAPTGKDGKPTIRKASARIWALACVREEVIEGGKVVGLRDMVREVTRKKEDDTEETTKEKAIVVVNQGQKNYFSHLQGFAARYGTILDRDYYVERAGSDTDTQYRFAPLDPIETENGRFDLRNPEFMERYKTDIVLGEIISERASDEFYARFFDPRFTVDENGNIRKVDGATEAPPKPDADMDPEKLKELASRVKGYSGGSEEKAEEGKPEEEAEGSSEAEPEKAGAASGGMRDFG